MSEASADDHPSLRPGDVVAARYCVGRLIARGGMGFVVAATHRELGTPFAIKVLKTKFARDETYLARFRREALAAASLRSEHVVRVVDFGRVPGAGAPFLVMEYLEGKDLASALAEARARGACLAARDVCDYVIQACDGLAVAHAAGIVHRDLKPANLFLTRYADGGPCIKVLDFGISKHAAAEDLGLTSAREVLGSPLYMSPEQLVSPRSVDARSDVWSLGVVLYELLAGRLPFEDEEFGALFMRIQTKEAPPLASLRPDVRPGLAAVVARCLQKDPALRYADVAALAGDLAPFASPGADHYVDATRRMNLRALAVQSGVDLSPRAPVDTGAPLAWPGAADAALDVTPRPGGALGFARRLFGGKTFAPVTGDPLNGSPGRRAIVRSPRLVVAGAIAGVVLGGAGWAYARRSPPAAPARLALSPVDLGAKAASPPSAAGGLPGAATHFAAVPVEVSPGPSPSEATAPARLAPPPADAFGGPDASKAADLRAATPLASAPPTPAAPSAGKSKANARRRPDDEPSIY